MLHITFFQEVSLISRDQLLKNENIEQKCSLLNMAFYCKVKIFVQFGYQDATTYKMCLLKIFIFSKMHFEWNINLFKDKFNKNSCINSSHFAHILWYSKFEFQPSFQSLLTWHCLAVKVWWTVESISDWKPPFYNFEIAMLF